MEKKVEVDGITSNHNNSGEEREKLVYLSKLYEKAKLYPKMIEAIDKFIALKPTLNKEERMILNTGYKSSIADKRKSWIVVNTLEKKEDSKEIKSYHLEIKQNIEKEIREICNRIIAIIDSFLIPNAKSNESKMFYLCLKGDYHRYLCEISNKDDLPKLIDQAGECYEQALQLSNKVNVLNSTRLSLSLNYSLFLSEIKKKKKEAISIAKNTYEDAVEAYENKKDDSDGGGSGIPKDSLFIMQLMKENYLFWTDELPDEEGVKEGDKDKDNNNNNS